MPPSLGVHWNWAKMDKWFMLREHLHLMHLGSPLSSPALVQQAFFSPNYPRSKVEEWQRWMPLWELLRWPIGTMRQFVSVPRMLENIAGLSRDRSSICIIAGSEDKLVGVQIPEKLANTFKDAIKVMTESEKTDRTESDSTYEAKSSTQGVAATSSLGVRFVAIEDAPPHFQNDIDHDVGARQLLNFIE